MSQDLNTQQTNGVLVNNGNNSDQPLTNQQQIQNPQSLTNQGQTQNIQPSTNQEQIQNVQPVEPQVVYTETSETVPIETSDIPSSLESNTPDMNNASSMNNESPTINDFTVGSNTQLANPGENVNLEQGDTSSPTMEGFSDNSLEGDSVQPNIGITTTSDGINETSVMPQSEISSNLTTDSIEATNQGMQSTTIETENHAVNITPINNAGSRLKEVLSTEEDHASEQTVDNVLENTEKSSVDPNTLDTNEVSNTRAETITPAETSNSQTQDTTETPVTPSEKEERQEEASQNTLDTNTSSESSSTENLTTIDPSSFLKNAPKSNNEKEPTFLLKNDEDEIFSNWQMLLTAIILPIGVPFMVMQNLDMSGYAEDSSKVFWLGNIINFLALFGVVHGFVSGSLIITTVSFLVMVLFSIIITLKNKSKFDNSIHKVNFINYILTMLGNLAVLVLTTIAVTIIYTIVITILGIGV